MGFHFTWERRAEGKVLPRLTRPKTRLLAPGTAFFCAASQKGNKKKKKRRRGERGGEKKRDGRKTARGPGDKKPTSQKAETPAGGSLNAPVRNLTPKKRLDKGASRPKRRPVTRNCWGGHEAESTGLGRTRKKKSEKKDQNFDKKPQQRGGGRTRLGRGGTSQEGKKLGLSMETRRVWGGAQKKRGKGQR